MPDGNTATERGASESRQRPHVVTLRVNSSELREFRLVARAEGVSTSEAIRNAMRARAEALTDR